MPRTHLTDLAIRNLKPASTYTTHWDTKLPGFGIRVGLRSKTFIIMQGETRRRISVGTYPALALADARKQSLTACCSAGCSVPGRRGR